LYGLVLKLHIPSVDDFYTLKSSLGAHLFIHNSTAQPVFSDGFDVGVNTETSVIVNREFATSLAAPYSSCAPDPYTYGSVFTDMFAASKLDYSQKSCFNYCARRKSADACGCEFHRDFDSR
jgi:hypothetical protein